MKRYYIPNSLFFKAIPKGLDQFLLIFSIEKKVHEVYNVKSVRISRANNYAKRMYRRMEKQSYSGNAARFDSLVTVIMARSKIFQVIALNQKYPKWFQDIKFSQFKKLWVRIMEIKRNLDSNIRYRRVWIPKGLQKYMRPLGCPDIEYIVQTWMINYLLNLWAYHNKGRATWQHGGFPGKGPNTFYDEFIGQKLWRKPFIYEFDIKGYFNNISHEAILKALEAIALPGTIYNHIRKAIKVQPYEYSLPPLELDEAVRIQQELMETKESVIDDLVEIMTPDPGEDDPAELVFALLQDEGDSPEVVLTKLMDEVSEFVDAEVPLWKIYEAHMKGKAPTLLDCLDSEMFGIKDRELGRDAWAGLGKENSGTPQGVSYSPTLTSIASSYFLNDAGTNLIMYMDDGLIYADSRKELDAAILRFEKGVKAMGVEIQPTKSGMVKVNGEWLKDLKIIGFRIDRFMDWIFSQTRSGTERPIPRPDFERLEGYLPGELDEKINRAIELLNKLPEGSKDKLSEWVRRQLEQVRDHPLETISKEGYTGAMLSHIWNPKSESRQDIQKGISKAIESLNHKKYTFIYDQLGPDYIEDVRYERRSIQNVSTDVNIKLLEWLERRGMNSSRR